MPKGRWSRGTRRSCTQRLSDNPAPGNPRDGKDRRRATRAVAKIGTFMKLLLLFGLSICALGAVEIPAGAVKSPDGAYHYTDARGKKWIYRATPWGIARGEDKPAAPL